MHLAGDNAKVVATDAQKNTVYAFARKHGGDVRRREWQDSVRRRD